MRYGGVNAACNIIIEDAKVHSEVRMGSPY